MSSLRGRRTDVDGPLFYSFSILTIILSMGNMHIGRIIWEGLYCYCYVSYLVVFFIIPIPRRSSFSSSHSPPRYIPRLQL